MKLNPSSISAILSLLVTIAGGISTLLKAFRSTKSVSPKENKNGRSGKAHTPT